MSKEVSRKYTQQMRTRLEHDKGQAKKEWTQDEWTQALTKRLGAGVGRWGNSLWDSRDQMIGILRELEDGEDLHKDDRRDGPADLLEQDRLSHRVERDARDMELGAQVDNGGFRYPPEDRFVPITPDMRSKIDDLWESLGLSVSGKLI
ncbi:MAG: hypothetical protein QF878_07180 [SAR202 cluster bacterium]|jgi:hypothetical protein|nr:hypothetical protein [SAR202 cluster bacterium]|tara:strand:- start:519 stop:962 length:444 start_codon:yes stop_codon:yes gene_type:complete